MSKVGVLSFSDGRDFVHVGVASFVAAVEERIVATCKGFGAEVLRSTEVIRSNEVAVREGRRMAAQRPDITIFNYPVWALPHFSVHAAKATVGPLLLFSNIDPTYPGMVSLLAAGGQPRPDRPGPRPPLGRGRRPRRLQAAAPTGGGRPRRPLSRGLHLRPRRRPLDGHVHRGRAHRRVDGQVRHRRRGDRPVGDRAALRAGPRFSGGGRS